MKRLLFTAPASGGGKTTLTCAFLALARRKGLSPISFKCGPDYLDPTFHRRALGVPGFNLDTFLCPPQRALALFAGACRGRDLALIEGAMGYYDGVGGVTSQASAWEAARLTRTPAVLILEPRGSALSLCAAARGFLDFSHPSGIGALFLNRCSPALYDVLAPALSQHTGLPVLGFLPPLPEAELPGRHLGLVRAEEVPGLAQKLETLADALEAHGDWAGLLRLAQSAPPLPAPQGEKPVLLEQASLPAPRCRIGVALDEAFCFYYQESLWALRQAGAQLSFFSPLRDAALPPKLGGLYLGGGYPELHAAALSQNAGLRQAVRRAAGAGLPILAECGGFLYLLESLEDEAGRPWPMTGVLSGRGFRTKGLRRFGYARLTAAHDSLLFAEGESFPVHEFHHWDCTQNGSAFTAQKPLTGRQWACGFGQAGLYAAFPHLYLYGLPRAAARFVEAAARFQSL